MPTTLDFERAQLRWKTHYGSVGAWRVVASVVRQGNTNSRTVLSSTVMAGDVYGIGVLPRTPAYTFQIAADSQSHIIWRDYALAQRDTTERNLRAFEHLDIVAPLRDCSVVTLTDIVSSAATLPMTCRISVVDRDGCPWLLEFPIQHLNSRSRAADTAFQVESGPILVPHTLVEHPEVARAEAARVGGFARAYVFFNRLDQLDLALAGNLAGANVGQRGYEHVAHLSGVEIALLI